MTRTKILTVAVEADQHEPSEQQIADAIADIPPLEGEVSVLMSVSMDGPIVWGEE